MPILIAKQFGGTSATNKERIFNAARRCIADYEKGHDVVVVLSARGKYTDELIASAKEIHLNPLKREMDMMFTIGEQMSVPLMAMTMDQFGVRSVSLNAFPVGMHTTKTHGNARFKHFISHLNPSLSLLHSNNLPTLLHKNTLCVFRYSHFVFIYWIYRIYTAFLLISQQYFSKTYETSHRLNQRYLSSKISSHQ